MIFAAILQKLTHAIYYYSETEIYHQVYLFMNRNQYSLGPFLVQCCIGTVAGEQNNATAFQHQSMQCLLCLHVFIFLLQCCSLSIPFPLCWIATVCSSAQWSGSWKVVCIFWASVYIVKTNNGRNIIIRWKCFILLSYFYVQEKNVLWK